MIDAPREHTARPATRIELDNGISFSVDDSSLPLTIGRDSSCDIHISSGHVSRKHCELFLKDGRLFLKDTSSNGTTVDDRLVRQSAVNIDRRTRVLLADEIKMILTPLEDRSSDAHAAETGAKPVKCESQQADSQADRRNGKDRRQRNVIVSFDRRSGTGERRAGE